MGTDETWGISGSTFLVVYVLIAVAVLVAAIVSRRSIRAGRPVSAASLQSRPEDVAYLNGGQDLAVYAALSAMHVDGSIATAGPGSAGVVHATGTPAWGASGLQRAIHHATAQPAARRTLATEPRVAAALGEIRDRLERAGLILTAAQRRAYRRPGFWMIGVAVLGLVRLFAGAANGRPVGYLSLLLMAAAVASVVLFVKAPVRTAAGDAALAAQRARHTALSPSMRPDWGAVGAGGAALSVGVFGVGALLAAQPAFAEELEAQKYAAMGGGGSYSGGGDGGSSGGDGGGGGGGCGGGGCGGGGCGG